MRILYIGSGEIGLPTLEYLQREHELCGVVAQPDKPAGRSQTLLPPPTKVFAEAHSIPVYQPRRIRNDDAVAELAALRPELIVVMAYGQILPKAILDMAPLGCLNLHASILPLYRGAAPIQAPILAGDAETGMTVMWMDEGLDTGDILLIHRLPIADNDTGGTLHDRLGVAAPAALGEALQLIATGEAPHIPQDNEAASYAGKLSRESGIIDWSADATQIVRLIRAMNPWPAASAQLPDGRRLKIFAAQAEPATGPAGTVLSTDATGPLIAAGSGGSVRLLEVQPEGKRRMPAGDWLRGTHFVGFLAG